MGNCMNASAAADANSIISANPSTNTRPSSTTGTSISTSNGVGNSAISSSAGHNRFWEETSPNGEVLPAADLKVYTYSDLKSCTRNFKSDMVLGVGGFGTIYKGWVEEKTMLPSKHGTGMMVAIKKLNHESAPAVSDLVKEVDAIQACGGQMTANQSKRDWSEAEEARGSEGQNGELDNEERQVKKRPVHE